MRTPLDVCSSDISKEFESYLRNQRDEFEAAFTKEHTDSKKDIKDKLSLFLEKPSRMTAMKFLQKRRLVVDQKNLSSKNTIQLSNFMYGLYQDNVLTYVMRIKDRENFEYVLRRGVSPLAANQNDFNGLHFAIKLERLEFLAFLFEGDYDASQNLGMEKEIID